VPNIIDFANENIDFLYAYRASPDAADVKMSVVPYNGGNAVYIDNNGNGTPYIAIDVSSILGGNIDKLCTLEVVVAVEHPDEEFYAVSGELTQVTARSEASPYSGTWSVYISTKNPNVARAILDDGQDFISGDLVILSKNVDNALTSGAGASDLIISELRFLDSGGNLLPVNSDAGFSAPDGFGKPDSSNLSEVADETSVPGAEGSSGGWGQAVALMTAKNDGGVFDASVLIPGSVITVYYTSATPPELILQSWTDGAPDGAGWAKVSPFAVNDSGSAAQFLFDDISTVFGTEDIASFLDQLYIGDSGNDLKVYSVTVGTLS
jgi:hypothetical protein